MKTLTENKLYMTDELSLEMHIADGIHAMIYDEADVLQKVTFGKGATLKYFGYFQEAPLSWRGAGGEYVFDKHFLINGEDNRCEVYSLLSTRGEKIIAKIHGELASSGSFLDMHIVSFVSDGGIIDLDGIVNIVEGVEKVEGYLVEENIFLGTSGKVRGLPTLLVHSNDVKASHACNMERISDDKLFYLRSRGLPKEDATVLMLESYISKVFGDVEEIDSELFVGLKEKILERVK